MSVNPIIDKAASQEAAIAGSQSILNNLDNVQAPEKDSRESGVRKILDSNNINKSGRELMVSLLNRVIGSLGASNSKSLLSKVENNIKDEYDLMFSSSKESLEDSADIRSSRNFVENTQNKKSRDNQNNFNDSNNFKGEAKDYAKTYANFVVNGSDKVKEKMEKMEAGLKAKGLSDKQISDLRQSSKNAVRFEITQQIKDAFLRQVLSPHKSLEHIMNSRALNQILDFAFLNEKIGGYDFGGYHGNLQGATNKVVTEVREELFDFFNDEIERELTGQVATGKKDYKNVKSLIKLAEKVGFDKEAFLRSWENKIDDIGLLPVDPELLKQGTAGSFSKDSRERNTGFEYSQQDEKEILINQLRVIYMQRIVSGSWQTFLTTSFRVRKLKNGLIKLGLEFKDFSNLEIEAKAMARVKLISALEDVLHERATFYDLSGPAYKLNERKIKGFLRNIEKLGRPLSEEEFFILRDKANEDMFHQAKNDLNELEIITEFKASPQLEKRQRLLIKLMERLKEESKLPFAIPTLRSFSVKAPA